jgi:hypothetical protein
LNTENKCQKDCCNPETPFGDANLNLLSDMVSAVQVAEARIAILTPRWAPSLKRTAALEGLQVALEQVWEALRDLEACP